MKQLSGDPKILTIDEFLKPDEIEQLISLGAAGEHDSTVVDGKSGEVETSNYRVCKLTYLDDASQPLTKALMERIASIAKVRPCQVEGLQVLRYSIGGHYFPHVDPFDTRSGQLKQVLRMGGQRIASIVIGLKQADKGGETDFNRLKMSLKLKPGEALFFWSLHSNGQINQLSEHSAMPVLEGEKIVLVSWIRERAFDGSEEIPEPLTEDQLKNNLETVKHQRELECFRTIESVLQQFNCTMTNSSIPKIDQNTGEVYIHKEIKVISR